ncbi:MAG TPA: HEPN domain-containing protein [Gemmatimonadales bacterium]|nr:HEPN domain-containing protein [Gemmatimonadales bacterium]HRZ09136.1 HEPN domain-containing protein [Gemmatimonadales bacterium]
MTTPKPQHFRPKLIDFAKASPPEWFSDRDASSVWVAVHRMAMIRQHELPARPVVIPLGDTLALVHWGTVRYTDASRAYIKLEADYSLNLNETAAEDRESVVGAWLALISPHDIDGVKGHEPTTRRRLAAAAGLLSVMHGDNIAYSPLTEGVVQLKDLRISSFGPVFRSPHALPRPNLSREARTTTRAAVESIQRFGVSERNRISLALHWHAQAIQEDGVEGFLKAWIALEVLAMDDTTDITPICESLGRAYGLTGVEARDRFLVGRLFGLRSRIVHRGRTPDLPDAVNMYLQSIFSDVLVEHLALPPRHSAGAWLDREDTSLPALLTAALAV